jgi:hypothetical protein
MVTEHLVALSAILMDSYQKTIQKYPELLPQWFKRFKKIRLLTSIAQQISTTSIRLLNLMIMLFCIERVLRLSLHPLGENTE